jgi:hypothetical protein
MGRTIRWKTSPDRAGRRQSDAHGPVSVIRLPATVLQTDPAKPFKLPLSCAFNTVTRRGLKFEKRAVLRDMCQLQVDEPDVNMRPAGGTHCQNCRAVKLTR